MAELAVELPHQRPAARHPELGAGRDDPEVGCGLGAANDEACDRRKAEERRAGLRGVLPVVRPGGAHAQNATWTGAVPGGDWNTNGNWLPASVPTGIATFDNTGLTQAITVSADASINTIALSAGAPTYSYTINAGVAFDILGAGIVNNSANAPNFLNNGTLNFSNSSTAANANIINNSTLSFNNTSTAASASLINNGFIFFSNTSTAATSTILNNTSITFQDFKLGGQRCYHQQRRRQPDLVCRQQHRRQRDRHDQRRRADAIHR